jgi:hypothetical protein
MFMFGVELFRQKAADLFWSWGGREVGTRDYQADGQAVQQD